jgi:hypothetical protein
MSVSVFAAGFVMVPDPDPEPVDPEPVDPEPVVPEAPAPVEAWGVAGGAVPQLKPQPAIDAARTSMQSRYLPIGGPRFSDRDHLNRRLSYFRPPTLVPTRSR